MYYGQRPSLMMGNYWGKQMAPGFDMYSNPNLQYLGAQQNLAPMGAMGPGISPVEATSQSSGMAGPMMMMAAQKLLGGNQPQMMAPPPMMQRRPMQPFNMNPYGQRRGLLGG